MKIVFASLEKLDFRNTVENVILIESVEQLNNTTYEDTTYVLPVSEEYMGIIADAGNEVYIPFTELTVDHQSLGWHVYFDLENYPFYQKVKGLIDKEEKPKGVFRFRRMVKQYENNSLLTGDLYVLSSLLGEPQRIQVKQTDQTVIPVHTIILMDFGGGTMAHIEYTVTNQERIELEWSGIKTILEFDSDQMKPINPNDRTLSPLKYSVDDIVSSAKVIDEKILNRLDYFQKQVGEG